MEYDSKNSHLTRKGKQLQDIAKSIAKKRMESNISKALERNKLGIKLNESKAGPSETSSKPSLVPYHSDSE